MKFSIVPFGLFLTLNVKNTCGLVRSNRIVTSSMGRSVFRMLSTSNDQPIPLSVSTDEKFQLLTEKIVYNRYKKVIQKDVRYPNGKIVSFDVISQGCPSILVFPWDIPTKTTTLVREYQPGTNKVMYGIVAGMYESDKHSSPLECAQMELEEEAQLQCDNWINLLDEVSIPFDKYSDNRFYTYLALNCTPKENPKAMDDDEFITIVPQVRYDQLMSIINKGEMNIASAFGVLLALRKLEQLQLLK